MMTMGLTSCTHVPGAATPAAKDAELVKGPPIVDIVTPFDHALSCLRGRIQPGISFAVGQVLDNTGKEQLADGGNGKFVTQGAGEMVQSALFRAGVTVINRRDPNISIVESNWGIRDIHRQVPVNFYISGSINSLDFVPGGGASVSVAGVGPRYQQSRILIGLDMTMTDAFTGRIVASVPLQKQIFASEIGASAGRFFGPTLLSLDIGGMQREAIHFTLRQMLSLATFELLTQLMDQNSYKTCSEKISDLDGVVRNMGTGESDLMRPVDNAVLKQDVAEAPATIGPEAKDVRSVPGAAQVQSKARALPVNDNDNQQVKLVAIVGFVRKSAEKAIAAAARADAASSPEDARKFAAEAMQQMAISIQGLRQAAALGLKGREGDDVALLVEQAMTAAQTAQQSAVSAEGRDLNEKPVPEKPAPQAVPSNQKSENVTPRQIGPDEFNRRFGATG